MPTPDPAPPAPTRALARLVLFIRLILRRMDEDGNFQQAAALTYSTLFSLLPTFVLALLIISMVSSSSTLVEERLLRQLALNKLQVQVDGQDLDLPTYINQRIESARALVQSPGTGLIALGTLIYGALSLMYVIERAFNRICRGGVPRPWARRISLYWSVLTLGPLAVALSLTLSHAFHSSIASVVGHTHWILSPATLLASLTISFAGVLFMYRIIPERPPAWRSALWGAVIGALLWELGKGAFGLYVRYSVGTRNWYGNLALVPLFMFWIYCTWNFVLMGLQVACCHQHFHSLSSHLRYRATPNHALTDLRWILPLGILLERRLRQGQPLTPDDAAQTLRLPPDLAENLLLALQRGRLVHTVEGKTRGFVLARPPEAITAGDLLDITHQLAHNITDRAECLPTDPLRASGLVELTTLEDRWARDHTLAALAAARPQQSLDN